MANLNCFGRTDPGLVRPNNKDTFLIKPDIRFCLVADGVGGSAAGELASLIFSQTALEVFSSDNDPSENKTIERVKKTFRSAHERILNHIEDNPQHEGMACTAELIAFHEQGFVIGHIGDSRTYRVQNDQLKQLTRDHSLVLFHIYLLFFTPSFSFYLSFLFFFFLSFFFLYYLSLYFFIFLSYPFYLFLLFSFFFTFFLFLYLIFLFLFSFFFFPLYSIYLLFISFSSLFLFYITFFISFIFLSLYLFFFFFSFILIFFIIPSLYILYI